MINRSCLEALITRYFQVGYRVLLKEEFASVTMLTPVVWLAICVAALEAQTPAQRYEDILDDLLVDSPECPGCPYETGSDCCHFQVKRARPGRAIARRQEQRCQTGLAWNNDLCECSNSVTGCDPLQCSASENAFVQPTGCPGRVGDEPLQGNECCIEALYQKYTLINLTHYYLNDDTKRLNWCPEGQMMNLKECACEWPSGVAPKQASCRYWPFEKETGTRDIYQRTYRVNRGVVISEGHNTKNGLLVRKKRALNLHFSIRGGSFSIAFWVKTFANMTDGGTFILNNGGKTTQPTVAFVLNGNTISGGIRTETENNTPNPTADHLFQPLNGDGWHFVAFIYEDPQSTLYTDTSKNSVTQGGGEIARNSCIMQIGGTKKQRLFIDELVICDFAFTELQVTDLRGTGEVPDRMPGQ
ncbi:unnamed protein product [Owenia fusiformis]|uniref:Uncharacterized protein n=1 Tax=Owenia fusiformis TaxID=6347 RepID=A0A8S4N3E9_OWEFU|nr:unnamed protein product [Owenia fusiformis]